MTETTTTATGKTIEVQKCPICGYFMFLDADLDIVPLVEYWECSDCGHRMDL